MVADLVVNVSDVVLVTDDASLRSMELGFLYISILLFILFYIF